MFWVISAVLIVIAIAFILPSLLKKEKLYDVTSEQNITIAREQLAELERSFAQGDIDKESYQSTRDELELSLFNDLSESDTKLSGKVDSPGMGTWLILFLIPLIAIPVYLNLGNLNFAKQLDPKKAAQEAARASMPLKADGSPDIEKITADLKAKMESNPSDPKGWYMLGRSYMLLKRFPEAAESFDKSLSLMPDRAETMLSLADALSMDNNGMLVGRPRTLVNEALKIEPQNVTALWLSGMAASQENEYSEAINQWQKVLPFLDTKPDEKTAVNNLIAEAKSRLKSEQKTELSKNEKQASNEADNNEADSNKEIESEIKVSISLSNSLKNQVTPDDYVFIYAKAMSGPPMPLAAVRRQVKDLPTNVVLDDTMAMMPQLKLSSFASTQFYVGARVSKTGQPTPQDGDLFIENGEIKLGDSISLEINEIYKK